MTTDELEIDLQEQRDTILYKEEKQWSTKASQLYNEEVDVNEDKDEDKGLSRQHDWD